jgi:glycosyltransferase involved in cell wall biosynthesis
MEAMAMGMAVVSTPVGDVPFRLTRETSMITSSVDEDVVVREMAERILSLPKERLEQMRGTAYEFACREFNEEQFTRSYRELLISPASSR